MVDAGIYIYIHTPYVDPMVDATILQEVECGNEDFPHTKKIKTYGNCVFFSLGHPFQVRHCKTDIPPWLFQD